MFDCLGRKAIGFDDFRSNGILLPAKEEAVWRTMLPLHRGPHRDYNGMVIERVGRIERCWSHHITQDAETACTIARMRLGRLQSALRNRLIDQRRPLRLNRRDPSARSRLDFTELDAMAEVLWQSSA